MPSFDNPIWKWKSKATNDHQLLIQIFPVGRMIPNYFVFQISHKSPISQGQYKSRSDESIQGAER